MSKSAITNSVSHSGSAIQKTTPPPSDEDSPNEIEESDINNDKAGTIKIAGKVFKLGKSEEEDAELKEMAAIAKREDG